MRTVFLTAFAFFTFAAATAQPVDDYDQIDELSYSEHIEPLLAARDAFGFGDDEAYAWDALFASEAEATIIPFDAEGSYAVRFVEDLPAAAEIPYPNLRTLEADELQALKRWIE